MVAGCHDCSVHIFHLLGVAEDRDGDAGVDLQVRRGAAYCLEGRESAGAQSKR